MAELDLKIENWFADTIGKCFELSVKDNYDSYVFAKEFLNSDWGRQVLEDYSKYYDSFTYMYAYAKDNLKLEKGISYDTYVMWMYGYLVKYWILNYDYIPNKIWSILPIDVFEARFGLYHTQGWNYIIEDAIEQSKKN